MTRPRPAVPAAADRLGPASLGQLPHPRPAPVPPAEAGPTASPLDPAGPAAADAAGDRLQRVDDPPLGTAVGDRSADQEAIWELVRRAQDGDAESFGQLYDCYVDVVFRFLHHRVGDRATAEDFTSETFVRALRRIDSLSFQGRDVGAWLITIARNIVLDHVKSSRYRLEVPTADMRDADRATDGPEDAVLQRLSNAELMTGLAQLPVDQRECLVLRFLQGMSVAETAAAMRKKEGAVKALQHRAVRRLASLLPGELR
jgi:RNA polymerase sigma-70 factor (ECF subfamily)